MRLLSEILLSPVTGPVRTAGFVLKRINEQVEAEYLDEGKVQAELLDLTMRYDHGEIDDEQYMEQEAAILEHLNDIRAYKEAASRVPDAEQTENTVDEAGEEPTGELEGETSEE